MKNCIKTETAIYFNKYNIDDCCNDYTILNKIFLHSGYHYQPRCNSTNTIYNGQIIAREEQRQFENVTKHR